MNKNSLKKCKFVVQNGIASAIEIDNPMQVYSILLHHENFAIDGDIVLIEEKIDYGDKNWIVNSIVTHNINYIIGYITSYKNIYYVNSYNSKLASCAVVADNANAKTISLNNNKILHLDENRLYLCKVRSHPCLNNPYFLVDIVNDFGAREDPQIFLKSLLIEQNVPHIFTGLQSNEASKLSMPQHLEADRVDLRSIPFITIDGQDAKDFDDAVYSELLDNKNYRLMVAIADVSFFVRSGSVLDQEAYNRGTSIYFPDCVIPMLPEALSNGLCSLQPEVDRLVMVCDMQVDQLGNIVKYQVYNAIIKSVQRTTYDQVYNFLKINNQNYEHISFENTSLYSVVRENVLNLQKVYQALLKAREKRGALDFNTVESAVVFDEIGHIEKIVPKVRNDAHKIIEECMLAANVSVADFIEAHGYHALYRVHGIPSELKISQLQQYVASLGIKWKVKDKSAFSPKDFGLLLKKVRKLDNGAIIEPGLLRYMMLAQYSTINLGHFGLAYEKYVHFTSPIRRYADLVIHRICKSILLKKQFKDSLDDIASHLLDTSVKADNLERTMYSYYKCLYAKDHIGNNYDGVITSVNRFGVFVYIPTLMLDGLVHINALADDFYIYDENSHELIGKLTGMVYSVGYKIKVIISAVELDKMFINLEIHAS